MVFLTDFSGLVQQEKESFIFIAALWQMTVEGHCAIMTEIRPKFLQTDYLAKFKRKYCLCSKNGENEIQGNILTGEVGSRMDISETLLVLLKF